MLISERNLRIIIREALTPEDEEFIEGFMQDLYKLQHRTAEVEYALSTKVSGPALDEMLKSLETAFNDVLSYEGQELGIGEDPDEREMLEKEGWSPEEVMELFVKAREVRDNAKKVQDAYSTRASAKTSILLPSGSTKTAADVRVAGRATLENSPSTTMFLQFGDAGGYELEVPTSWDGATVGSKAPALSIGGSIYSWVLGMGRGHDFAMIGTNGTHWYLMDRTGLYRLPSLAAAKELAARHDR